MANFIFEDIPVDSDIASPTMTDRWWPRLRAAIERCMLACGERPSSLTIQRGQVIATREGRNMSTDYYEDGSSAISVVGPADFAFRS